MISVSSGKKSSRLRSLTCRFKRSVLSFSNVLTRMMSFCCSQPKPWARSTVSKAMSQGTSSIFAVTLPSTSGPGTMFTLANSAKVRITDVIDEFCTFRSILAIPSVSMLIVSACAPEPRPKAKRIPRPSAKLLRKNSSLAILHVLPLVDQFQLDLGRVSQNRLRRGDRIRADAEHLAVLHRVAFTQDVAHSLCVLDDAKRLSLAQDDGDEPHEREIDLAG